MLECRKNIYASLFFTEIQENSLANIQAEVVMNGIPPDLIFNWDQTALHLISTGLNRSGEKVIAISNKYKNH